MQKQQPAKQSKTSHLLDEARQERAQQRAAGLKSEGTEEHLVLTNKIQQENEQQWLERRKKHQEEERLRGL